jgi:uncharacterized protein YjbI with pentapeptide repeats
MKTIFEIKHRWNGSVLFSIETESWKLAVEAAIKSKANLSWADLSKADLSKANLSKANLSWANLSWANLSKANLSWADLSKADLSKANLSKANLSWANLSWANLSKADLSKANLSWANLSEANLSEADLSWADLSWADLSKANLSEADLSEANLSKADLSKANLSTIKNDFWNVLLHAKAEIGFLKTALKDGRVDGSTYTGECACLVGTIANARKCDENSIPGLLPDSCRPAERFFMGIKKGDKPGDNPCSRLALEWAEELENLLIL